MRTGRWLPFLVALAGASGFPRSAPAQPGPAPPAVAPSAVAPPAVAPSAVAPPVAAPAAPAAVSVGARPLTMAAAIEAALANNPQLAMEAETITAAEAKASADSKLRLPLLSVKANVLFWDRAIVAELGDARIPIRERVTGTVDVSISQPISGAAVIGKLVALDHAAAEASRAQRDGRRIEIAYQTAETYLGALQARTLGEVATATLQQLDADLQRARILQQAGTLQQVDVLRLEAERARIEQQALEAETAALAARRGLALLLGLPDGTELSLVEIDTAPPPLAFTEEEAVVRARRDRADLRVAKAGRDSADLGIAVARSDYFPSVSLLAIYSHAINAGSLGSANSGYLGLALDWNLWDWGKRAAQVEGARANSRKARLAQGLVADQVAVDARGRWQAARSARATLEVTARGLAAAVEVQRLQTTRFAHGAATTVEVIDAETSLANARAQEAISRYQYLVAWMALSRAVGSLPVAPQASTP